MKNIIQGITFCTIVMMFILGMFVIGQVLSNFITMNMIMTVAYIALGYSFIYLIRN